VSDPGAVISLSWSVISLSCAAPADLLQCLTNKSAGLGVTNDCSDVLDVLLNELGVLSGARDCVLCACG
jgi:hypothetical protein